MIAEEVQSAIDALAASPLHALSLSSRELFYSNLLAWAIEQFPDQLHAVWKPWLDNDDSRAPVRVRREWKHLDLVIELPGNRPLVVENKSLAIPDEPQLARYDSVLESSVAKGEIESPTRVLLSPVSPGWSNDGFTSSAGGTWRWLSYGELGSRLRDVFHGTTTTGYEVETVRHLATLLERLQGVLTSELARPEPDQLLLLPARIVDQLQRARVHHMVMKARASHVGALVRSHVTEPNVASRVTAVTGMSHGVTLVDGFPQKPFGSGLPNREDDRFQWQIQGADLRLAAVFESLTGRDEASRKRREEAAEACRWQWFDFAPAKQILGDRCGPVSTSWLRFDPVFVYRKVSIKRVTVGDVVALGSRYSHLLADAGRPRPMPGLS